MAPLEGGVQRSLFVLPAAGDFGASPASRYTLGMALRRRIFEVEIVRLLDPQTLDMPDERELDRADEEGDLAGNRQYQDLRGFGWKDVASALEAQADVIASLAVAPDWDAALAHYEAARFDDPDAPCALWFLDIGVAPAVVALSALGCIPVSSCDAGDFGAHHIAAYPSISFYLARRLAPQIVALAEASNLGLTIDDFGLAHLYARSTDDRRRFAVLALDRRQPSE